MFFHRDLSPLDIFENTRFGDDLKYAVINFEGKTMNASPGHRIPVLQMFYGKCSTAIKSCSFRCTLRTKN